VNLKLPAPAIIDKLETADVTGVLHNTEHRTEEFTRWFDDAHGLTGVTGIFYGTHSVCYWITSCHCAFTFSSSF
jgi:hypothetical protein